ncbi:hypothetical protein TNCV_3145011 [Trichonephila clavipes]|nr:hypothetical protein TNCV_3145011 [Trichonephila clavipes]
MAVIRCGIDTTSFWKRSTGMPCQILAKAVHNSVRFIGAVRWLFVPCSKISQRCSIGLKSVHLGGLFIAEKSEKCTSNQPVAKRDL